MHDTCAGLELHRFMVRACRALRLKNLGPRPKIQVPDIYGGSNVTVFVRCMPGIEPKKSRCPMQNIGASGTRAPVNFEPCM